MKEIVYNEDELNEKDINREVKRAKLLIENSNGEIILVFSHNNYFFVGGHVEENETFNECITRELEEETGIKADIKVNDPFLVIKYLNKDYPEESINTKSISAYYAIHLDLKPDLSKLNLTDSEKDGNFELRYIKKELVLQELENSLVNASRINVVKDTIEAVKVYLGS